MEIDKVLKNYRDLNFDEKVKILQIAFGEGINPYDLYKNYKIHNGTVSRQWKYFCKMTGTDPDYSKNRKKVSEKIIDGEKYITIKIPGYENYLINDYGKIYSLRNNCFFVGSTDKDGYKWVGLRSSIDGIRHNVRVHQAVLRTFVGDPPDDMVDPTVDHINGKVDDNRISNLRWLSRSQNGSSSFKQKYNVGKVSYRKLTDENVHNICKLFKSGKSPKEISQIMGIKVLLVKQVCDGNSFRNISKKYGMDKDKLDSIPFDLLKSFYYVYFTYGMTYKDRAKILNLSSKRHRDLLENLYSKYTDHVFTLEDCDMGELDGYTSFNA